jgi:hypothetical protein
MSMFSKKDKPSSDAKSEDGEQKSKLADKTETADDAVVTSALAADAAPPAKATAPKPPPQPKATLAPPKPTPKTAGEIQRAARATKKRSSSNYP